MIVKTELLQNSGPAHGNLSNAFEERDITIALLLFNDMEMSGPVFCVFYNLAVQICALGIL